MNHYTGAKEKSSMNGGMMVLKIILFLPATFIPLQPPVAYVNKPKAPVTSSVLFVATLTSTECADIWRETLEVHWKKSERAQGMCEGGINRWTSSHSLSIVHKMQELVKSTSLYMNVQASVTSSLM
jgi:hypothetical protein